MATQEPQRIIIDDAQKLVWWDEGVDSWNKAAERRDFDAMAPGREYYPVLKSDGAMALWKYGKEEWNEWVASNFEADVDFSGESFSAKDGVVDFSGYRFPNGNKSFVGAKFPNADVTFHSATFGEGDVSFFNATFGAGNISFDDVTFGKGDVLFRSATFGSGQVGFDHAKFGA
ncbi:MAG: pentapeptide repeat-containing protein, partial [Pseudomonadota bacterium]